MKAEHLQDCRKFSNAPLDDGEDTTIVIYRSIRIDSYAVRAELAQHARDEGTESSTFHYGLAVFSLRSV